MKTGEGKTLVATLPVYLNTLSGKGVHVITVNDYLARRDAEWMGILYKFLGLSFGVILHGVEDADRKWAYNADITYGTNNEFGFDYLRDNMKFSRENFVQRELNFTIVDEVDSILIDEARTPLIISGPAEQSTQLYYTVNQLIPFFKKDEDFTVDEKSKTVILSEPGVAKAEKKLKIENLYDPRNISLLHHVNQALRAKVLFKRDVDYVIKEGAIVIVDEFTGRLMPGRRWSDGLHQAVEAKEGVRIENENQTLATITFQNFFRMYNKLSGMTGTADTEAAEFAKIYNLDVMVIPTNMPMIRKDQSDEIYKTERGKFRAVINEIKECHEKGQPVLVGTISIDKSEKLSGVLKRHGIFHNVLNAKNHEREAEIISQAGRKGAVTISTNMAGRGVDIMLGGNPGYLAKKKSTAKTSDAEYKTFVEELKEQCDAEKKEVLEAGGLHIIGTERHESRRIDNQLRGRAGRQGDPGSTTFFLSLEDDLLRVFGGEKIMGLMDKLGMEEDEVIQHPWLSRAIANAQKRVEDHNFAIRKNLLEYDDVMNQQRRTIYALRKEILSSIGMKEKVIDWVESSVGRTVDQFAPDKINLQEFEFEPLRDKILQLFGVLFKKEDILSEGDNRDEVGNKIFDKVVELYEGKRKEYGEDVMSKIEKYIILENLDSLWKDHLLQMDHLKEGIGLRGYAQRDPLVEYKREGYNLFLATMDQLSDDVVEKLMRVQIKVEDEVEDAVDFKSTQSKQPVTMGHGGFSAFSKGPEAARPRAQAGPGGVVQRRAPKVGRNDPCSCGSGKKYKKCCGK
jgi:preprotein translocase subunit SecA